MTTVVIDDKKKGAQEMLELLRALDFVACFEKASENNALRLRRQGLIEYPNKYDTLALAGAAEGQMLDLAQIRRY